MKRILLTLLTVTLFIALSACDDKQTVSDNSSQSNSANFQEQKILVAYFSMPEATTSENMNAEQENSTVVINGEVLGNTQYMAQVISENTGGELFRIEPSVPYPTDHAVLIDQAQSEQSDSARPGIAATIDNIEQYDTVFLGYPNWWGDMPMILYSFLEEYDLSDKTIIPFNTHGGSGFSGTIETIQELEQNAKVQTNGLSISRDRIQDAEIEIISWLNTLGYNK